MKLEIFKNLLFYLPIINFQIKENSMEPAIKEGSTLLVSRYHYFFRKPKANEIVILHDPTDLKRFIIKRIKGVKENKIFVVGDNEKESIDSRQFGWVDKKDIVGKVIGV